MNVSIPKVCQIDQLVYEFMDRRKDSLEEECGARDHCLWNVCYLWVARFSGIWLTSQDISIRGLGALAVVPYFVALLFGLALGLRRIPGFLIGVFVAEIILTPIHQWSLSFGNSGYIFGPVLDGLAELYIWVAIAALLFLAGAALRAVVSWTGLQVSGSRNKGVRS